MKPSWTCLGALGLALILAGCSSSTPPPAQDPPAQACIVSTGLPDTAIGRLGIQVIQIGQTMRIVIPADTVFEGRTANIKESAHDGLNDVADILAKYPNRRMAVIGYTDELGSYSSDASLSELQAQSLITYFWTRGVPHKCLQPVGYGKDESGTVASNRSINGKTANRRVEIIFRV